MEDSEVLQNLWRKIKRVGDKTNDIKNEFFNSFLVKY